MADSCCVWCILVKPSKAPRLVIEVRSSLRNKYDFSVNCILRIRQATERRRVAVSCTSQTNFLDILHGTNIPLLLFFRSVLVVLQTHKFPGVFAVFCALVIVRFLVNGYALDELGLLDFGHLLRVKDLLALGQIRKGLVDRFGHGILRFTWKGGCKAPPPGTGRLGNQHEYNCGTSRTQHDGSVLKQSCQISQGLNQSINQSINQSVSRSVKM
jgi:hypothetical protein